MEFVEGLRGDGYCSQYLTRFIQHLSFFSCQPKQIPIQYSSFTCMLSDNTTLI